MVCELAKLGKQVKEIKEMKEMEEAFGKANTAEMSVRNREEGN